MKRVEETVRYPAEFYHPVEMSVDVEDAMADDSGHYRCEFDYPWFNRTSDIFVIVKCKYIHDKIDNTSLQISLL